MKRTRDKQEPEKSGKTRNTQSHVTIEIDFYSILELTANFAMAKMFSVLSDEKLFSNCWKSYNWWLEDIRCIYRMGGRESDLMAS